MKTKRPKILYAIQATGNGHAARALAIVPILKKYADVEVFMSGRQCNLKMPFEIKHKSLGFSFLYDKKGGLSYWKTLFYNNPFRILSEILHFDLQSYDFVINDFESISAWACKRAQKPCIALSHQASFLSEKSPRPRSKNFIGEWVLRNYAPASKAYGFHFRAYDDFIFPAVLRSEILNAIPSDRAYYTVYLPAYSDAQIIDLLQGNDAQWQVFSKNAQKEENYGNIHVLPAHPERFTQSLIHCTGLLTSAGFESPAEALYLGKKLLVSPIKKQYEQYCNAAALQQLGAQVCESLHRKAIQEWISKGQKVQLKFDDFIENLIIQICNEQGFSVHD